MYSPQLTTNLNKLSKSPIPKRIFNKVLSHEKHTISNKNSVDFCANVVRQHDYENFLATLLMTKTIRSPALVVRAFNVEVARAQDLTTDLHTAELRLQFWKDTLTNIYDVKNENVSIPANPVAQELFKICCSYKLPKRNLERLINSRMRLLKSRFFQSLDDLEKYSDEAVSSIYYILLEIAGIKDLNADHAASHLGKAQGIINMLRSVHITNMQKVVTLPMDVLMKHQVSQEKILRGVDSETTRNIAFDIACRADSHLKKARSIKVPKLANQIFLPAIAIDNYLKKLEKHQFNLFAKPLQLGSPILPINMYFSRLMNKY